MCCITRCAMPVGNGNLLFLEVGLVFVTGSLLIQFKKFHFWNNFLFPDLTWRGFMNEMKKLDFFVLFL